MATQKLVISLHTVLPLENQAAFRATAVDGKFPGSTIFGYFTAAAFHVFMTKHPGIRNDNFDCAETLVTVHGFWRRASGPDEAACVKFRSKFVFVVRQIELITRRDERSDWRRVLEDEEMNKRQKEAEDAFADAMRSLSFRSPRQRLSHELSLLGLSALPSSRQALRSAWHRRLKSVHPDAGGLEDDAKAVNAAYQTLLGELH